MMNLISIHDLSKKQLNQILYLADLREDIFSYFSNAFRRRTLGTVFFEPSTRTKLSFQCVFQKLGGHCIGFTDIEESRCGKTYSESIEDFAKVLSTYCDIMIFRTGKPEMMKRFVQYAEVPVISAGHGAIEHPTQSLIDLYTIKSNVKTLNGLHILICGNPQERTVNSLLLGLSFWKNINVHLVCPSNCKLQSSIQDRLVSLGLTLNYYSNYHEFLKYSDRYKIDVIYQEVLNNEHNDAKCSSPDDFCLTLERFSLFDEDTIILHPLPRSNELPHELDSLPNSKYFTQVVNGMYIRAAVLLFVLQVDIQHIPLKKKILAPDNKISFESSARNYSKHFPAEFVSGEGSYLFDSAGKKYIDFLMGAGSLILGHNHPRVIGSINNKLNSGIVVSSLDLFTPERKAFANELLQMLPHEFSKSAKILFCGPTGSDAVEAAVKLFVISTGRYSLASFYGAYHGMTLGALSLSDNSRLKLQLNAILPETALLPYPYQYRCPFNVGGRNTCELSIRAVEDYLKPKKEDGRKPAMIIVEAIQGEAGCIPASIEWLRKLRQICDEYDVPLVLDEIQTGGGRTGKFCAFEHADIIPDAILLSKSIGGGFPISILAYNCKYDTWQTGDHAGTFRGNQIAMIAGHETLKIIQAENLLNRVDSIAELFHNYLKELTLKYPFVGEFRQVGLMIGIEIVDSSPPPNKIGSFPPDPILAKKLQERCFKNGLIVELGGKEKNTIRLLPPINVTSDTIASSFDIINRVFDNIYRRMAY